MDGAEGTCVTARGPGGFQEGAGGEGTQASSGTGSSALHRGLSSGDRPAENTAHSLVWPPGLLYCLQVPPQGPAVPETALL